MTFVQFVLVSVAVLVAVSFALLIHLLIEDWWRRRQDPLIHIEGLTDGQLARLRDRLAQQEAGP